MPLRQQRLIAIIFVLVLVLLVVLTICLAPGSASASEACPAWKAERDVNQARKALRKAERRLAEARRVLSATRTYAARYGPAVGRWVRLSRRVGWPWPQMPTLMAVMDSESQGDPAANGGVYLGLLQIWTEHVADPARLFSPWYNLLIGRRLWQGSGWGPWLR